jgi:hypothetical protein
MKDALIPETLAIYEFVTYSDVDDVFVNEPLILDTLLIPIYVEPSDKFMKDALIPDTFAIYEFVCAVIPLVAVIKPDAFIMDVFNVPLFVVIEPAPPILIGTAVAPAPVPILMLAVLDADVAIFITPPV